MTLKIEVVHKIESLLGKFCDSCDCMGNSYRCTNNRKIKCYLESEISDLRTKVGSVENKVLLSMEEKRERKLKKQRETYKKSIMRSSVNYM